MYLRVLQWIRLRKTRKTYPTFFIALRCQQNILAQASLHIFIYRISVQTHFFCSLRPWDVIPTSTMSFGNGKKGSDGGQKLVTVAQLTQWNNYGWEAKSGMQTCSSIVTARSVRDTKDSKSLSGHSSSTDWTERGDLLTPEQVFMQSGVTFRMENRSAGCKTSVSFPLQAVLVWSAGREAKLPLVWHRIMWKYPNHNSGVAHFLLNRLHLWGRNLSCSTD